MNANEETRAQRRLSTCSEGSDLDFVSFYIPLHHSLLLLLFFIICIIIIFAVSNFWLYLSVVLCVLVIFIFFHTIYLCDTVNASPLTFRIFIIRQCHLLDDMVFRFFFFRVCIQQRRRSTAMLAHARSPPLCPTARHIFVIYFICGFCVCFVLRLWCCFCHELGIGSPSETSINKGGYFFFLFCFVPRLATRKLNMLTQRQKKSKYDWMWKNE